MNFKTKMSKLYIVLILLTLFIIPKSVFAYSNKVYLGGENIGIEVKSKGVLVVGFYNVNGTSPGQDAGLKLGDIITMVDDTVISSITDLSDVITSNKDLKITYIRNEKTYTTTIKVIKESNIYKTGLYVKDKIVGIGTLSFITQDKIFGALGHEIIEQTTNYKFEIEEGKIFKSTVSSINKSERNDPGEKNAKYYSDVVYGNVLINDKTGIYGEYKDSLSNKTLIDVASKDEITTGPAKIVTVLEGDTKEEFDINIIKIYKDDNTKNILFEITDEKLLSKTNGVVQGMSGSPIIQNNKLIGAVNYVIVDNPKRGYGIFITNMLEESDKVG